MEIRRTIKATDEEMSRVFDYDEILNVKYCEKQKNGLFRVRFRIPECSLKDSSVPITLKKLKENVVKACSDTYRVIADVTYSDGTTRRIYASTFECAEEYAQKHGKEDGKPTQIIKRYWED
ncbi:MAG: hypothetical protein BWY15_02379 [Firmicutes bacterium ADurb.Bin193]|nr:MAG: hypothetical protein BWY15_02379 [Firmicutes bacterium ADurb.Bin193]